MDKQLYILVLSIIVLALPACKKGKDMMANGTATINVINGAINAPVSVKMNEKVNKSGGTSSSSQQASINFGSGVLYFAEGKLQPVQVVKLPDSTVLFTNTYDLKKGGVYTMIVTGIVPNVEGMLLDDTNMPYVNLSTPPSAADSVINIRFINLCQDAQPLDIRVQGNTSNEATALPYKGYTAFKSYPAKITNYSGTVGYSILAFDVVENGVVRTSTSMFVFTNNRFKNIALVITGMKTPGPGQPGLSIKTINYFQ